MGDGATHCSFWTFWWGDARVNQPRLVCTTLHPTRLWGMFREFNVAYRLVQVQHDEEGKAGAKHTDNAFDSKCDSVQSWSHSSPIEEKFESSLMSVNIHLSSQSHAQIPFTNMCFHYCSVQHLSFFVQSFFFVNNFFFWQHPFTLICKVVTGQVLGHFAMQIIQKRQPESPLGNSHRELNQKVISCFVCTLCQCQCVLQRNPGVRHHGLKDKQTPGSRPYPRALLRNYTENRVSSKSKDGNRILQFSLAAHCNAWSRNFHFFHKGQAFISKLVGSRTFRLRGSPL